MAYKRGREKGIVCWNSMLASGVEAIMPALQRDENPCFLATYQTPITVTKPLQWVFSISPGSRDEAAAVVSWFHESWIEKRPPRIGDIFYDHASGWESLEGIKEACRQLGAEFIGHEVVPMFGLLDSSTEWLRMAGKKPDLVYVNASGSPLSILIKDAARLEINKKGITLVSCTYLDETIFSVTGEDVNGWYCLQLNPTMAEAELPGLKPIVPLICKYTERKPDQIGVLTIRAWLCVGLEVEAIRLAMQQVGLENLTGKAVRDGFCSIRDFENGIVPPVTMTNEKPYAQSKMRIYLVRDLQITPYSDWFEPRIKLMFK